MMPKTRLTNFNPSIAHHSFTCSGPDSFRAFAVFTQAPR
ncbi:hypothetical protein ABIA65_004885 [Mycolicibacterium sp. 624]